jgi:hypothetical protein
MVRALTTNLIPDPQKSEEEMLAIEQTPSQYPPMTSLMAKTQREIRRHPARTTLLQDTKTMLLLATRPTCRHQSIKRSNSQREESSYAIMMESEDEAVTSDAETIRHDRKIAEMADPREGTDLVMMTACTMAATKTSIAQLATMMIKRKAPATMMMIHIHEEQKEAVVVAKISRRTARANGDAILRHPHQEVLMVEAVVEADQQGHGALARIRQTRSPTTSVPI